MKSAHMYLTWAGQPWCHAVLPQLSASFAWNYNIVMRKAFSCHCFQQPWSMEGQLGLPPRACRASHGGLVSFHPLQGSSTAAGLQAAYPTAHVLRFYGHLEGQIPNNPGRAVYQLCTSLAFMSTSNQRRAACCKWGGCEMSHPMVWILFRPHVDILPNAWLRILPSYRIKC